MTERASVQLIGDSGQIVVLPLAPETLSRHHVTDAGPARIEFTAYLDDRHALGLTTTAETLLALAALGAIVELQWGKRIFAVGVSELTVVETAFDEDLGPIAATVQFDFEVDEPS